MFQFHKGSINTDLSGSINLTTAPFQFHKGSINTKPPTGLALEESRFNSIKVRLIRRSNNDININIVVSIP